MQLELWPGEFQAQGTAYQREGGRESRLSGMEWFGGGVEWGGEREEVGESELFRLVTGWTLSWGPAGSHVWV